MEDYKGVIIKELAPGIWQATYPNGKIKRYSDRRGCVNAINRYVELGVWPK